MILYHGGVYEKFFIRLDARRFYFHRRRWFVVTFSLSMDGFPRARALLRRQRIHLGTHENPLFPYAPFYPYPRQILREYLPELLERQIRRYANRRAPRPPSFLYLQRRAWKIPRLGEYRYLFPLRRNGLSRRIFLI